MLMFLKLFDIAPKYEAYMFLFGAEEVVFLPKLCNLKQGWVYIVCNEFYSDLYERSKTDLLKFVHA